MLVKPYLCLAAATGAFALPASIPDFAEAAIDSGLALKGLNAIAVAKAFGQFGGACNSANVKVRREWRSIPKRQRREFIAAVKCVQIKPSILPPGEVPGAKSLYDDFVWAHATRGGLVHMSATFLVFHRYYLWAYEKALEDCGWDSGLPYWEWGLDVDGPHKSPLFDGSDTSLGSDGTFVPNRPPEVLNLIGFPEPVILQPGTGGGCVFQGPFSDLVVRLGPFPPDPERPLPVNPVEGREENPRCLDRDLNAEPLRRWSTFRNVTELILGHDNIRDFHGWLEGDPRVTMEPMGCHGGGHGGIGGIGRNPIISPNEPAFWLTHNQLDRVYWIWQMLDFENRQNVHGTGTYLNIPPSPNVTVEDTIDVLPHAPPEKIKNLMNSVGGTPLCYVYV
ncbi:Tyrosinase copper-binding domain-containing protein [Madurella fahalii]|uniref:Tyrosinase copper-binding domain-containing protein n=1 Tax=Madurella fahalii TaxID=1157608 RepID=A0ABQ0GG84_9PEZI